MFKTKNCSYMMCLATSYIMKTWMFVLGSIDAHAKQHIILQRQIEIQSKLKYVN